MLCKQFERTLQPGYEALTAGTHSEEHRREGDEGDPKLHCVDCELKLRTVSKDEVGRSESGTRRDGGHRIR